MSNDGDGGSSALGCVGCSLVVPAILFIIGISIGSAPTIVVALSMGAIFGAGAYLLATDTGTKPAVPEHSEASAESGDGRSAGEPRGSAFFPWVRASRMQKVVGEFYRQAGYDALAKQHNVPRNGERATINETAHIGLDRENRHAQHGTAITVWVSGQHLGFLPDEVVGDYLDVLTEIDSTGQHVAAEARIYLGYNLRKRSWSPSMVIRLPEPDKILPLNGIPPRAGEIIPDGPSIQVTGEKDHQDVLVPLADPVEKMHYAATLQLVTEQRARSAVETIEVTITGERVGTLTPTSTAKTRPIVELIESGDRVPYARAIVTSTEKGVEVTLRITRIEEAPVNWIRKLEERRERRRQDSDAEDGRA